VLLVFCLSMPEDVNRFKMPLPPIFKHARRSSQSWYYYRELTD
jgi:hypothetical protein